MRKFTVFRLSQMLGNGHLGRSKGWERGRPEPPEPATGLQGRRRGFEITSFPNASQCAARARDRGAESVKPQLRVELEQKVVNQLDAAQCGTAP